VRAGKRILGLILLLTVGIVASACGGPVTPQASDRLKVVTTVAPLTNIVRNIGGERIDLQGIVPEGTDSHTFEPAPSDARLLSEADLVLVNGLHLETPTEKLAEQNKKAGATIYRLGDNTISEQEWIYDFSFPKESGDPNPHLWMNVAYARKYAELTRDQLAKLDPANKDYYDSNFTRYAAALDELDKGIVEAIKTIPEKNRRLVTYHDSFAYFAPRYGMTVIGAVQPADFKEPSPQDMAAIIDQLKKERVPAIFGSEVYPSKVLDQIGKEADVQFVSTLRDDDLPGDKDSPEHTYIGMMLENVRTMTGVLGGNADALKGIKPDNTYQK
jgi:ABC-type Zn uptake system ZnuABC Zn-binding protein ZnuA